MKYNNYETVINTIKSNDSLSARLPIWRKDIVLKCIDGNFYICGFFGKEIWKPTKREINSMWWNISGGNENGKI